MTHHKLDVIQGRAGAGVAEKRNEQQYMNKNERSYRGFLSFVATKKVAIVFGVAVVVVVAGVVLLRVVLGGSGDSGDGSDRQEYAVRTAGDAMRSGNEGQAGDIYEKEIDAETDPTKKVELAIDHSSMLYGAGKHDRALDVATEAEAYSEDKYLIADWLGRLYEARKMYGEARKYYELALKHVESPTNNNGYTKKHYDKKIAAMTAAEAAK